MTVIIKNTPGLTVQEALELLREIVKTNSGHIETGYGGFVVDEDTASEFLDTYLIAAGRRQPRNAAFSAEPKAESAEVKVEIISPQEFTTDEETTAAIQENIKEQELPKEKLSEEKSEPIVTPAKEPVVDNPVAAVAKRATTSTNLPRRRPVAKSAPKKRGGI